MRVHLIGNTCNNNYSIAKALRKIGVDAHLYYNSGLHFQTLPESDDPHILDNFPDWLHPYKPEEVGETPFRYLAPELSDKIKQCDIIQAEDVGLIWAAQSGKPYLWSPYGWDLNFYSFSSHWQPNWFNTDHPEYLLASLAYREAIVHASAVVWGSWYKPLSHGFELLSKLVSPERLIHNIPGVFDTDQFSPGSHRTAQELIQDSGSNVSVKGLVFFYPSRIMFTEKSYTSRANDRFIRACAKLQAENFDFTLVLVKKGNPDEEDAEKLIDELAISDRVVWVDEMTRAELVEWYRAADIVPDDFIGGGLGSVSYESISCGTPHLTYFLLHSTDETFWPPEETFEELPPLINVSSEAEILQALIYFSKFPDELKHIGEKGRIWAVKYLSSSTIAARYVKLYENILASFKNGIHPGLPLEVLPLGMSRMDRQKNVLEAVREVTNLVQKKDGIAACHAIGAALDKVHYDEALTALFVKILNGGGEFKTAKEYLNHAAEIMESRR